MHHLLFVHEIRPYVQKHKGKRPNVTQPACRQLGHLLLFTHSDAASEMTWQKVFQKSHSAVDVVITKKMIKLL